MLVVDINESISVLNAIIIRERKKRNIRKERKRGRRTYTTELRPRLMKRNAN